MSLNLPTFCPNYTRSLTVSHTRVSGGSMSVFARQEHEYYHLPPRIMEATLWTSTFTFHTHLNFIVIRRRVYVKCSKTPNPPCVGGRNGKIIKYMWQESNLLARPPQVILKYKVGRMTHCGMDGRWVIVCLLARARGALFQSYHPDTRAHTASHSNDNVRSLPGVVMRPGREF